MHLIKFAFKFSFNLHKITNDKKGLELEPFIIVQKNKLFKK